MHMYEAHKDSWDMTDAPLLKQRKEKLNLIKIQSIVMIGPSPKVT